MQSSSNNSNEVLAPSIAPGALANMLVKVTANRLRLLVPSATLSRSRDLKASHDLNRRCTSPRR